MVTLYDVARRAAVSTATVSRVVHGQDLVRESTRIRVQQAIEELGYVPDGAAQSLSRRRKDIIGMMCLERGQGQQHDIETECLLYYDEVQRGVQARIRDSQWLLLSTFMQADGSGEPELSRLNPLSGKVDGILLGEGSPRPGTSSVRPRASPSSSSPGPSARRRCQTPWCAPTTRWPSASCGPSPQPASASPTR
jgi:DNA-binding LacI/PurR family transcriptional regulator